MTRKKRIVILGGGFGGIYTAIHLQKLMSKIPEWELVLVNRENYFVYQPMLAEVVGGTVGILDTVSPLSRLLKKTHLIIREIEEIDLEHKQIIISPKFTHSPEAIEYDHLVFALGNVTDFRGASGLYEHAFPFKNLADALRIRNHLIDVLETAEMTEDIQMKKQLLTFVVGGGGFSGTEIVAEMNDFVRKFVDKSPHLHPRDVRVILIHNKERLMDRELSPSLSVYAGEILANRGVEILFNQRLKTATPDEAILDSGEKIASKTIISTVPSSSNPILEGLPLPMEKNKLKTDATMLVAGSKCLWAVGDCASIPLGPDTYCPPTAQFAIREAKMLAQNIVAEIHGKRRKPFFFKSLGMMGALGHRRAVAELFGFLKLSGFLAWMLWRAIYWIKLPGIDRKFKVAFSWLLDTLFPLETIQLKMAPSQGIAKLHFEPGDLIFKEGDIGDYLYIITQGSVNVIKDEKVVASLKKGEFFGEIALLNNRKRTATIRAAEPTDVLALKKSDFGALIANFKDLRDTFEKAEKERK